MSSDGSTVKGEVEEVLGAVTGDRRVEAEGRAKQRASDPDDPLERVDDDQVDREEDRVRREHHDI